jgi:hypothetical protein
MGPDIFENRFGASTRIQRLADVSEAWANPTKLGATAFVANLETLIQRRTKRIQHADLCDCYDAVQHVSEAGGIALRERVGSERLTSEVSTCFGASRNDEGRRGRRYPPPELG